MKIVKIEQQTNNKFLNMFNIVYEKNGKQKHWSMASRNNLNNLICVTNTPHADTVTVAPRFVDKDGEQSIILNKEFRIPINDYVYSFVSGLVDAGETPIQSCLRELEEEIGAKPTNVSELNQLTGITYNSEGMSDETSVFFEANIKKLNKQKLQGDEDISVEIVKIKDLPEYMKNKQFSTMCELYLHMLTREHLK